ncbi:MAG TPA: glycosyltransferase family 4 protein [Armatimonadota bacterium]|nr:glycosyltransferase family 4 protein [Armatimonadota bacterium]HQK93632.1 glycosyltransferase family 4 protein [Armatimonadota bacterium]
MIRVLCVNHCSGISGAEVSLLTLLSALDRSRYEPHVAAPPGGLLDHCAHLGVPVHPISLPWVRRPRGIGDALTAFSHAHVGRQSLKRLADELDPGLIHANSTVAQVYASALHPGRAVIWHARDMQPLGVVGPYLSSHADALIAVSRAALRYHYSRGCRPRLTRAVYNGVDCGQFHPGVDGRPVRQELGVPEWATVFGCIGQAVSWKRHQDFIGAARCLEHLGWHFVLVRTDPFGHGEPLKEIIGPRLHILEGHGNVPALIAALDVLVLPSAYEPFGRTLIEAMALAKPVIATDTGGPPEVVVPGHTGLIVPTGDVAALAAAMERLGGDPGLRRRMGEAGHDRVLSSFTAEAHARAVEAVYEEVLAARASS